MGLRSVRDGGVPVSLLCVRVLRRKWNFRVSLYESRISCVMLLSRQKALTGVTPARPGFDQAPLPGSTGRFLFSGVCATCFFGTGFGCQLHWCCADSLALPAFTGLIPMRHSGTESRPRTIAFVSFPSPEAVDSLMGIAPAGVLERLFSYPRMFPDVTGRRVLTVSLMLLPVFSGKEKPVAYHRRRRRIILTAGQSPLKSYDNRTTFYELDCNDLDCNTEGLSPIPQTIRQPYDNKRVTMGHDR